MISIHVPHQAGEYFAPVPVRHVEVIRYHKAKSQKSALLLTEAKGKHTGGVRFALIPSAPGLVGTKLL